MINGDINEKRFFSGNFAWKMFFDGAMKVRNFFVHLQCYKLITKLDRCGKLVMFGHQTSMHSTVRVVLIHLERMFGK